MCVLQTAVLFLSLSASCGVTQVSMTKVTSSARRDGPVSVLKRVYQTMPFLPLNLADFLVHLLRVGLALCTVAIYHSAISAFGTHHHQKASNHNITSKLMWHFYYSTPFM